MGGQLCSRSPLRLDIHRLNEPEYRSTTYMLFWRTRRNTLGKMPYFIQRALEVLHNSRACK